MNTIKPSYLEIPLWPNGAPTQNGLEGIEDMSDPGYIGNVTDPALYIYPAPHPNGQAVIICPGGGLSRVAIKHEGHDFAEWFNTQGITVAVLKYRMPNGHKEVPVDDVQQAIRIMRSKVRKWEIRQLGIMGASIGGYLAAAAAVFPAPDTRPDFQVLLYPVISMKDSLTHLLARDRFMGEHPSEEDIAALSLERHVTHAVPPAFIVLTEDDQAVDPDNSIRYYQALMKNIISAELHIYPSGGHCFGFHNSFPYKMQWMGELSHWLKNISLK